VKHNVGAHHRIHQRGRIKDVPLDKGEVRLTPRLGEELRNSGRHVVVATTRKPIASKRSTRVLPMNPAAPMTRAVWKRNGGEIMIVSAHQEIEWMKLMESAA
jgi:hypothetical protein